MVQNKKNKRRFRLVMIPTIHVIRKLNRKNHLTACDSNRFKNLRCKGASENTRRGRGHKYLILILIFGPFLLRLALASDFNCPRLGRILLTIWYLIDRLPHLVRIWGAISKRWGTRDQWWAGFSCHGLYRW